MSENDQTYYRRRAEIELERAQQAEKPEVVRVHCELAEAYLGKIVADERVVSAA